MLGFSMEELGCKRPISWKWGCRGDVALSFARNPMSFGGLELQNKLLKCANLIIVNCQRRR
jgi:hypothetical protein